MNWDIPSLEELEDAVWKCTAWGNCKTAYDFGLSPTNGAICAGCQNQCELDHKPVIPQIMEALRCKAVEDGVGPMPTQKAIAQSMGSFNNPYPGPRRVRTDWTRPFKKAKKPIKNIMKENAPILFYVGCTGAGCFRTIKKDYSLSDEYEDYLGGIKIIHTTDFLFEPFKAGNNEGSKRIKSDMKI
jgi:Fe-S oxidoreductase